MKTRMQMILEKVSEIIEGTGVPLYPDNDAMGSQYTRSPTAWSLHMNRIATQILPKEQARFYASEIVKQKKAVREESGRGRVARQDFPRPDPQTGRMIGIGSWSRFYPKTDPFGGVERVSDTDPRLHGG